MSNGTDTLSASLEDYLETILALEEDHRVARVKDIADRMGVLRGSVTGALKSLAEKALIHYEPYSYITLTAEGRVKAREITRRHAVIKNFLQNVLLLDDDRAESNACRMEHAMDRTAVDRLIQFIEYIHDCPRTGQDWIEAFVNYYSQNRTDSAQCRRCLQTCLQRFEQTD